MGSGPSLKGKMAYLSLGALLLKQRLAICPGTWNVPSMAAQIQDSTEFQLLRTDSWALPLTIYVTLGGLLYLSVPQFPHL